MLVQMHEGLWMEFQIFVVETPQKLPSTDALAEAET